MSSTSVLCVTLRGCDIRNLYLATQWKEWGKKIKIKIFQIFFRLDRPDEGQLLAAVHREHEAAGRRLEALAAHRADGQLPRLPEEDAGAAAGDRIRACSAAHVRYAFKQIIWAPDDL